MVGEVRAKLKEIGDQITRYAQYVIRREERSGFPTKMTVSSDIKKSELTVVIKIKLDEEIYKELTDSEFVSAQLNLDESHAEKKKYGKIEDELQSFYG